MVEVSAREVAFDPSPSATGQGLTAAFGTAAVLAAASRPVAAAVAVIGVVAAVAGVRRASQRLVTAGALLAFAGVLLAGVRGAPPPVTLAGAAAVAVAWDVGTNAVAVGRQLGAGAATARIEVVHALASALFATVVGAGALAAFRLARGDAPTVAVAALFGAAVLFAWLLDR